MMKMQTQFGDMVITDENTTLVTDALKKNIEENLEDDKKPQFTVTDQKEMDK